MNFDWADVAAVGLIMRDTEADDFCGGAPTFRRVSQAVANGHATRHAPRTIAISNYEHHKAIAAALREAYEAGTNEATQETISAAYYIGRKSGYEDGYEDGLEDGESALWETK